MNKWYSIDIPNCSGMTSKELLYYRKENLKTTQMLWYAKGYDSFGPIMGVIIITLN